MRVVRKALTFDDVLLVPAHSLVVPRDVSLATRLTRTITLNIPHAKARGSHPPFPILAKQEAKNDRSMASRKSRSTPARSLLQPQRSRATQYESTEVIDIVPVTAMP